jgi:hypothetical protein
MATTNKKGGFGTSCFKPIVNVHEVQFVASRDNGTAAAGDIWDILDVCPGDEISVVTTVMTGNSVAATISVGDTVSATRYVNALSVAAPAVPTKSATTYFQAVDDTVRITFNAAVTDARFAVQVYVTSYVAEEILLPGGDAR